MKRKKLRLYLKMKYGGHGRDAIITFANHIARREPKGGASYGAVRKWLDGDREPRKSTRLKIEHMTDGFISLSDW